MIQALDEHQSLPKWTKAKFKICLKIKDSFTQAFFVALPSTKTQATATVALLTLAPWAKWLSDYV